MYGTGDPHARYAAASNASVAALKLDPNLAVGFTAQGMVALFGHQDYLSAQQSFRSAIRLDSSRYEPWLYPTWSYVGRGLLDSAVWSMHRAYQIDPVEPIVTARLSEALLLRGDTTEALQPVNELLSRDPTNVLGHAQRLEVYNATGPGHCADALREVRWFGLSGYYADDVYAIAALADAEAAVPLAGESLVHGDVRKEVPSPSMFFPTAAHGPPTTRLRCWDRVSYGVTLLTDRRCRTILSHRGTAMRLNLKVLAIAFGVIWGAGVFLVGVAHLLWPGYGGAFLDLIASIYPGYHVGGFGTVIVATLYAVVDGAVGGAMIAWLYNMASSTAAPRSA